MERSLRGTRVRLICGAVKDEASIFKVKVPILVTQVFALCLHSAFHQKDGAYTKGGHEEE